MVEVFFLLLPLLFLIFFDLFESRPGTVRNRNTDADWLNY
jgi:hypothetical protein